MSDYIATTTFMAEGKEIRRGTIVKGKTVCRWANYQILEAAGYIHRVESPEQ
jgi:hypothetical protein